MMGANLSIQQLRECFTSGLKWKARPRYHFKSDKIWSAWNSRWSGVQAFTSDNGRGYATTTLTVAGTKYRLSAHRVVFALTHGSWPLGVIDHIDGNPSNNDPNNLRDTDLSGNARNSAMSSKNTSGVTGVYWFKPRRCWTAAIGVYGASISLGYFKNKENAVAARKAAERAHGFTERHGT